MNKVRQQVSESVYKIRVRYGKKLILLIEGKHKSYSTVPLKWFINGLKTAAKKLSLWFLFELDDRAFTWIYV